MKRHPTTPTSPHEDISVVSSFSSPDNSERYCSPTPKKAPNTQQYHQQPQSVHTHTKRTESPHDQPHYYTHDYQTAHTHDLEEAHGQSTPHDRGSQSSASSFA